MKDGQAKFSPRICRGLLIVSMMCATLCQAKTSHSDFNQGWAAYEKGEYAQAINVWTALAESGHENAQINLGFMYDYGKGVTQSFQTAAKWYRAAAYQDSAIGQYNLAILISEGKVHPHQGRSAHYWLKKSAALGNEDAQRELRLGHITQDHTDTEFQETKAYADESPVSIGTAWPIAAGYAVTNHHVVSGKQLVKLVSRSGKEITANVIASNQEHDIAFLRVNNPSALPPALPFSQGGAPLGTSVFTIGFPRIDIMGKTPKLSHGIISGVNGLRDDPTSYQISVPIQPGNSGGPLLNMRGEVVGMITAMLGSVIGDGEQAQPIPNINYAVKIDIIEQFLSQVPRPSPDIDELAPNSGQLEGLAAKIQDSVLMVMAE